MENEELEKHLFKNHIISMDIWKRFIDAYGYDNSASIPWLIKKLAILYKRVITGEIIPIEGKSFVFSKDTFQEILDKEFSGITLLDVQKVYKDSLI